MRTLADTAFRSHPPSPHHTPRTALKRQTCRTHKEQGRIAHPAVPGAPVPVRPHAVWAPRPGEAAARTLAAPRTPLAAAAMLLCYAPRLP